MPKTTEKIQTKEQLNSTEQLQQKIEQIKNIDETVDSFDKLQKQIRNLNKINDLKKSIKDSKTKAELEKKKENIENNVINFMTQLIDKAKTDSGYEQIAKSFEDYLDELEEIDKNKKQEIQKLKEEIKNLPEFLVLTNSLTKKVKIENKTISIPLNMAENFDIKKEGTKIIFKGKENLPISFEIEISKNEDDFGRIESYTPWIENIKLDNGGNYYVKDNTIMFSYKKNGKNYLGVVGFNFDYYDGEISHFRTVTKEVDKVYSKKELEEYFDSVYDSGWFDSTGYTIKKDTILSGISSTDIGVDEKSYKELSKEFKNQVAFDTALKLIEAEIATNPHYLKYFDIGLADKEGINTGNILGIIITKLGLSQAGLLDSNRGISLKKYYELLDKNILSPYEAGKIISSIKKYPNFSQLSEKDRIKFLLDFDNSGKLGDYKETYFGEKQVYELLSSLTLNQQKEKIKQLEQLGGKPKNTTQNTILDKFFLKRGLDILVNMYGPSATKEFLGTDKTLEQISKETYEQEKTKQEKVLKLLFGKEYKKYEEKVSKKAEELYNKLPDDIKKHYPDLTERIKNAISFAGVGLAYVANPYEGGTGVGTVNFKIDDNNISNVIDHIDIGLVNHQGEWLVGIGLGKNFNLLESENKRRKLTAGYNLVNFTIPVLSLGGSYDFSKTNLEDWTDKTSAVVSSIGWIFPGLIGNIGYNFERKGKIDQKVEKYNNFLHKLIEKIQKCKNDECPSLNPSKYSDKVEKYTISVIKEFLNRINFFESNNEEYKKFVLEKMVISLSRNYETLNYLSNQGTKISEGGIIWAVILPVPYFKTETIKTYWEADIKSGAKDLDKILNHKQGVEINLSDIKGIKDYINSHIGKEVAEIKNKHIEIDLSKLPKGYILTFGPNAKVKFHEGKILLGGNFNNIYELKFNQPGEHFHLLGFGKGAIGLDLQNNVTLPEKYVIKDKNGKLTIHDIKKGNKIENLTVTIPEDKIGEEYKKELEKLINSILFKLIDKAIDGSIFTSKEVAKIISQDPEIKEEGFTGEYSKLISLVKNGEPLKALEYFRNIMLKRLPGSNYTPLAYFMIKIQKIGQHNLDKFRHDLDRIIATKDEIKAKILLDKVISNLFKDTYLKYKENYLEIAKQAQSVFDKYKIEIHKSINNKIYYKLPNNLGGGIIPRGQELALESIFLKKGDKKSAEIMHKWYFAFKTMYEFDTTDLVDKQELNRSAGFARSLRNEIFFPELLDKYGEIDLGVALDKSKWFISLDKKTQERIRNMLSIIGEKGYEKEVNFAKTFETIKKETWFQQLPENIKDQFETFYNIILASNKYISAKEFKEKPTYNRIIADNIIAFPYTYKLAVKKQHGHVPIYGEVSVVDKNGDGKFNKNDYEVIKNKNVKEYVFNMLTDNFKNSLIKSIYEVYGEKLTQDELKKLFIENKIEKNGKTIELDYELGLFKWGDCFNTALGIINLSIGGNKMGIVATTGTVYLMNKPHTTTVSGVFGFSHVDIPGSKYKKPEEPEKPEDTSEDTPSDSNSAPGNKASQDDSVSGW